MIAVGARLFHAVGFLFRWARGLSKPCRMQALSGSAWPRRLVQALSSLCVLLGHAVGRANLSSPPFLCGYECNGDTRFKFDTILGCSRDMCPLVFAYVTRESGTAGFKHLLFACQSQTAAAGGYRNVTLPQTSEHGSSTGLQKK